MYCPMSTPLLASVDCHILLSVLKMAHHWLWDLLASEFSNPESLVCNLPATLARHRRLVSLAAAAIQHNIILI